MAGFASRYSPPETRFLAHRLPPDGLTRRLGLPVVPVIWQGIIDRAVERVVFRKIMPVRQELRKCTCYQRVIIDAVTDFTGYSRTEIASYAQLTAGSVSAHFKGTRVARDKTALRYIAVCRYVVGNSLQYKTGIITVANRSDDFANPFHTWTT